MKERLFKTTKFESKPLGKVDRDAGVIEGIAVCTVGEAKGHGVHLEQEFIENVARLGNERVKQGIKMRFNHPNICASGLGTFIGRAKNFRVDGDIVRADAFISSTAKDSEWNMYDYIFSMAETEPDMFGTSISFRKGKQYKRDSAGLKVYEENFSNSFDLSEKTFVEIDSLFAVDYVDDPAANDGLFSTSSVAGNITEFLNSNPEFITALADNPDVVEAIAKHGEQIETFLEKYEAYKEQDTDLAIQVVTQKTKPKSEDDKVEKEIKEEVETVEVEKAKEVNAEEVNDVNDVNDVKEVDEVNEAEEAKEKKDLEQEEVTAELETADTSIVQEVISDAEAVEETNEANSDEVCEEEEKYNSIQAEELAEAGKLYGAEIAFDIFSKGGSLSDCKERYFENLVNENRELKKQVALQPKPQGEKPSEFSQQPEPKKSRFNF